MREFNCGDFVLLSGQAFGDQFPKLEMEIRCQNRVQRVQQTRGVFDVLGKES